MAQQLRKKTEGDIAEIMKQALERKGQAASGASAKGEEEEDFELGPRKNPKTGEIGGPKGPEPTRFNDWERGGRCSDF